MSKADVIVKNIVIQIGEKELVLNLDEAKELQEVLNDVLGEEVQVVKMLLEKYPYKWWYARPYQWNAVNGDPLYPAGTFLCSSVNNTIKG